MYHQDWIKNNLDPQHPIFISRVWTSGILVSLKSKVYTGCMKNEVTKLCATGIPPHIVLCNWFKTMESGVNTRMDCIEKKVDDIPDKVKQSILENYQLNGVSNTSYGYVQCIPTQRATNDASPATGATPPWI